MNKEVQVTIPVMVRRDNRFGNKYSVVIRSDKKPEVVIGISAWQPNEWAKIFKTWSELNE